MEIVPVGKILQVNADDMAMNLEDPTVGTYRNGNIDKGGICYHVMTCSLGRDNIFYPDVATYRHNMMCSLCANGGIDPDPRP